MELLGRCRATHLQGPVRQPHSRQLKSRLGSAVRAASLHGPGWSPLFFWSSEALALLGLSHCESLRAAFNAFKGRCKSDDEGSTRPQDGPLRLRSHQFHQTQTQQCNHHAADSHPVHWPLPRPHPTARPTPAASLCSRAHHSLTLLTLLTLLTYIAVLPPMDGTSQPRQHRPRPCRVQARPPRSRRKMAAEVGFAAGTSP